MQLCRYSGLFGCLSVACIGAAQNLVPNGSFEEYTNCPEFFGYAQYATGWLNLHTNSADYFNRCDENVVVGVPFNSFGYQEPAEGDGYIGIATTVPGSDLYREIVGIELLEPLQVGVPICLSFKMAVGGFGSWDGNSAIYTSKGVGLRFFMQFPSDWPAYLYPNTAALHMEVVPTDTADWYLVSGVYVADSNYTHLGVGNFFADSLNAVTDLDTTGFGSAGVSYAFIDDVRVSNDPEYCGSTGIYRTTARGAVGAYPNPFWESFTVTSTVPARGNFQWDLWDAYGQQVLSGSCTSGTESFAVSGSELAPGTYLLRLYDSDGALAPILLISLSP